MSWAFPRKIALVLILSLCAIAWPLWRFGSAEIIMAVLVGAALSTLNVLTGYLAIEFSLGKSYTTFLKAVLGGMGLRLLVMLVLLLVLIKVFSFHVAALTISLLGYHALYLVLEIMFIQNKVLAKNQG